MPSKLYTSARATLTRNDKQSLAAFDRWLERARRKSSGDPVDGRQLLTNLKAEAHFTGAATFGQAAELAGFLERCARGHRAIKGSPIRVDGYQATCGAHAARGLGIPTAHLPGRLLRYSTYLRGAADLVERVLGMTARMDFDAGRLSPEDAFAQIGRRWRSSQMRATDWLAGGTVWATFRHKKGTPRADAKGMAAALALVPRTSDVILLEFAYERDKVQNHRFPTVADAGLTHQFRPAREVAPDPSRRRTCWGWTKPTGAWPAQPEIVHDNASLQVLRRAPRLIGRLS